MIGYLGAILKGPDGVRTIAACPLNMDPDLPAPVDIQVTRQIYAGSDQTELPVKIVNILDQEIEGFLEIISPYEAWGLWDSDAVRTGIKLPPLGTSEITFALKNSKDIIPGTYWAVLKWHAYEEQAYSESIRIVIPEVDGTLIQPEQGLSLP